MIHTGRTTSQADARRELARLQRIERAARAYVLAEEASREEREAWVELKAAVGVAEPR